MVDKGEELLERGKALLERVKSDGVLSSRDIVETERWLLSFEVALDVREFHKKIHSELAALRRLIVTIERKGGFK